MSRSLKETPRRDPSRDSLKTPSISGELNLLYEDLKSLKTTSCISPSSKWSSDELRNKSPSPSHLFSLLWSQSQDKLRFDIPQTVIFDSSGRVHRWLFTSKDGFILRKSPHKATISSIKDSFLQLSQSDPTNIHKFVSVVWKGRDAELVQGDEFFSICEGLVALEEDDQVEQMTQAPSMIQVYTRPLLDQKYTSTYFINEAGEIKCEVSCSKYHQSFHLKDRHILENVAWSGINPSAVVISEVKKATIYLLQYLGTVYNINPTLLVTDFIQENNGRLILSCVQKAEYTLSNQTTLRRSESMSRPNSVVIPSLDFRNVGGGSRPSSARTFSTNPQTRASSRAEPRKMPHPPISDRPTSAPVKASARTGRELDQPSTGRGHERKVFGGDHKPGSLVVELTKEMDACKAQLASVFKELASYNEKLREKTELADRLQADYLKTKAELDVVAKEKQELNENLSRVWIEAKQQAQDLKKTERVLQEHQLRMVSLVQEKDSLSRHLSDVIVGLKSKIGEQAAKMKDFQNGGDSLQLSIENIESEIRSTREFKAALERRRTELQALISSRDRDLRLKVDRFDRNRLDASSRKDLPGKVRGGVAFTKAAASSSRKYAAGEDATEMSLFPSQNGGSISTLHGTISGAVLGPVIGFQSDHLRPDDGDESDDPLLARA